MILLDETIPEVKMTSQGLGEPFRLGEKIIGYQVCRLKSKAHIGIDEKEGPEKRWRKSRIFIAVVNGFSLYIGR